MRRSTSATIAVVACVLGTLPLAAAHHRKSSSKTHKSTVATSSRPRAIDDARATEIQTALVKAGYLPTASGHWDDTSAAAMRKLQSDNGWQTKLIPDSRALIKLGLGPGSAPASYGSGGGSPSASTANGGSTLITQ